MNSLKTKKELNGGTLAFIICFATAIIIFLPFVIVDKGLFLYCGDFNSQQIPFYYYANNFFKNTPGQWSWLTDLGGSMANSYSFYLLGSPFFWLSAMFPAAWIPFLMVPLFGVKFGVAGLGAYLYIKRYAKSRNFAVIGACLYAFSGFTVYNTFFNHFVDCIALFPFLLWALDEFVYEKRRGIFVLFVAINLINNYFFFAGEVVFLFIYFIAKVLTGDYKIRLSRFALLAFESLLGVGMGCLLLIPAVLSLRDNPRTIDMSNGFGLLLYNNVQQYFEILASLFFPPDPPYLPNMFTEGVIKWTS
ncbi:MAG: YfhO family protein, partial [Oscillospiraceae bacterium]